jgi:hypothetical protein
MRSILFFSAYSERTQSTISLMPMASQDDTLATSEIQQAGAAPMSTTPPTGKVVREPRRLIFSCNRLLQIGSLHRANNQPYR